MKESRFFLIFLILIIVGCDYEKSLTEHELLPPESFFALNDWTAQRAYPYDYVNDKRFLDEFRFFDQ